MWLYSQSVVIQTLMVEVLYTSPCYHVKFTIEDDFREI